jgi:hypothetical protein
MTEIGWLHQRNYFTVRRSWAWLLGGLAFLAFLSMLLPEIQRWPATAAWAALPQVQRLTTALTFWSTTSIFLGFAVGIGMVVLQRTSYLLALLGVALGAAFLFGRAPLYVVAFGVFLPTIIHVAIFTGAFILHGALRNRSVPGYLSLAVFAGCMAACLLLPFDEAAAQPDGQTLAMYMESNFAVLNASLYQLGHGSSGMLEINSDVGLRIQSLVAFAYTYHYLNWFSKARIIRWHEAPRSWIVCSIVTWVAAVALFAWDYRTGLFALLFLSLLHIFVEFPLDYRTVVGIGGEIRSRVRSLGLANQRRPLAASATGAAGAPRAAQGRPLLRPHMHRPCAARHRPRTGAPHAPSGRGAPRRARGRPAGGPNLPTCQARRVYDPAASVNASRTRSGERRCAISASVKAWPEGR